MSIDADMGNDKYWFDNIVKEHEKKKKERDVAKVDGIDRLVWDFKVPEGSEFPERKLLDKLTLSKWAYRSEKETDEEYLKPFAEKGYHIEHNGSVYLCRRNVALEFIPGEQTQETKREEVAFFELGDYVFSPFRKVLWKQFVPDVKETVEVRYNWQPLVYKGWQTKDDLEIKNWEDLVEKGWTPVEAPFGSHYPKPPAEE